MADLEIDNSNADLGASLTGAEGSVESVDVDLSKVPEKSRAHVDPQKYVSDEDYKRAVEHGWKPLNAFVDEGGDEAVWSGYKKFNRNYDDMVHRREVSDQLKETQRSNKALMETFEQTKREAIQQALLKQEALFKAAVEEGNTAEAVKLQRQILEGQSSIAQTQPKIPEPLPIVAIRRQHEALNPQSENFDPEANAEFERVCIQKAKMYREAYGRPLDAIEIRTIGDEALDMIKDKLKKPEQKPVQKAASVAKPAATDRQTAPKMNAIQKQMYDKLAAKHGKAVADNYLQKSQSV